MFYKPNKKKNGNLKFDSTDVFTSNLVFQYTIFVRIIL